MLKVFLAEDEVVVREGIKNLISWSDYGYEFAGEAPDGEIAYSIIKNIRPDVLITDIRMPFMSGLALSRLVRKELPDTHIIILSGHDDFQYAQEALNIGVKQYILKPISKERLIAVLEEMQKTIGAERDRQDYYSRFRKEMQEYELYALRELFEKLVSGYASEQELIELAARQKLDLKAERYAVLLMSILEEGDEPSVEHYQALIASQLQDRLLHDPRATLFRHNLDTCALLVRDTAAAIDNTVREMADMAANFCRNAGNAITWSVAVGDIVDSIGQIPRSFHRARRALAYRHLNYHNQILDATAMMASDSGMDGLDLANIKLEAVDMKIIDRFLKSGVADEVDEFMESYFENIGLKQMQSLLLRQHIVMGVQFTVALFLENLGCERPDFLQGLSVPEAFTAAVSTVDSSWQYVKRLVGDAVQLRDDAASRRYRTVIHEAVRYIDENCASEEISLGTVAQAVHISPTHFSAVFSREMGMTFIEYLTQQRMKRAKELLRCTNMRSSDVAAEVGYRDPHYFSFLFKKTQGMTPSEYRKGKGERS